MAGPDVTPITSYEQFQELLKSGELFIVDFWATWCGPCRMIRPVFDNLAKMEENKKHLKFYSVDVDDQSEVAQEVGIRAMPTFIAFQNGEKIDECLGAVPVKLQTLVKNLVQKDETAKAASA